MPASVWTAADLPDMTGRTVVVTGASAGLGEVTARELAGVGAHVVLAVRDVSKGERVAATITGSTEVRELELTDLSSVRAFAANWTGDLDILINNAGIMAVPEAETVDGFERQIGTNHLGHFALTNLLLPAITGRVVTISSQAHRIGRIDLGDLNWERRRYHGWPAYAQSKLANLLFTAELQRRFDQAGSDLLSVAAHPGAADTDLFRGGAGVFGAAAKLAGRFVGSTPADGAVPTLYAATQDVPGNAFFGPGRYGPQLETRSRRASDPVMARGLWQLSARLTGTDQPALASNPNS